MYEGAVVQKAENSSRVASRCINQNDCGKAVENESEKKWRCDAWTD